jgi:hypothetical protein
MADIVGQQVYKKKEHSSVSEQSYGKGNTTEGLAKGLSSAVQTVGKIAENIIHENKLSYQLEATQAVEDMSKQLKIDAVSGRMSEKEYVEKMIQLESTANDKIVDPDIKRSITQKVKSQIFEGQLDIKQAAIDRAEIQKSNNYFNNQIRLADVIKNIESGNATPENIKERDDILKSMNQYENGYTLNVRTGPQKRHTSEQIYRYEAQKQDSIDTGMTAASVDKVFNNLEDTNKIKALKELDFVKETDLNGNFEGLKQYKYSIGKDGKRERIFDAVKTKEMLNIVGSEQAINNTYGKILGQQNLGNYINQQKQQDKLLAEADNRIQNNYATEATVIEENKKFKDILIQKVSNPIFLNMTESQQKVEVEKFYRDTTGELYKKEIAKGTNRKSILQILVKDNTVNGVVNWTVVGTKMNQLY